MSYNFMMPTLSVMGSGALATAVGNIKEFGYKKAFIVTDAQLNKIGALEPLTSQLSGAGIGYEIFDGTHPNPTVGNVEEGEKLFRASGCDLVISFGGGSPHDCAKAIALVSANGGSIKDYEGINKSKKPQIPLVAVNTTAGTASEITVFAIITDTDRHVKMAIVDRNVNPTIAVNDPELMVGMPPSLTAATGMDALTHAIEAYVSISATPVTDACAVKAISLIHQYLKRAVDNGKDLEARENMAFAEYLAGMAFNNASLGYVHAMAHQLGGFYDLAHGVCNAVLLPRVEAYNKQASAKRLAELAIYMGENTLGLDDNDGADKLLDAIIALSDSIGIPQGLSELGVKEEDFPILADNALKDACSATNPVKGSKEDIIGIFAASMDRTAMA